VLLYLRPKRSEYCDCD